MALLYLMVEDVRQLVGIHATTRISHRYLNIIITLSGRDIYMTTVRRKLTSIIS